MPVESHLQECKCVSLKTHTCYCRTHTCSHPSISRWLSIPLPDSVWSNLRNREKGGPVQRCVAVARGSWDVPASGPDAGARGARGGRLPTRADVAPIVRHTYAVVFNEISISKSDKISDIERRDEYPITPTACAAAGRASGEARGPVQRTRGPARGNAHTARAHALLATGKN